MYKREFDKLTTLPNYCLFYGNEFYLKEYEKKIEEKFKNDDILKLIYDDYDFQRAKNHLLQNSLFGGKSVLIIRHSKSLKEIKELISIVKDNYFFFFFYSNKGINEFGKNQVRFFEPSLKELVLTIQEYERKFNISLSNEARLYLAKSVDALFLEKEIEKLSLYKKEIYVDDVKELVFAYKDESFEELFEYIIEGKEFLPKLDILLEKNDFRRILSSFIRYIRDLYTYYLFIKTTGEASLEKLLGYKLPISIEQNRVRLAIKLKDKNYLELLDFLLAKELEIRQKGEKSIFYEVVLFLKNYFTLL